jgi:hypothetical protein
MHRQFSEILQALTKFTKSCFFALLLHQRKLPSALASLNLAQPAQPIRHLATVPAREG